MERHQQAAYKPRLLELRRRLMREVNMAEEALREDLMAPGEVSTMPTHPADVANEGVDEEISIAQNEERMLEDVEAALERIEDGTYGNCQNCGREIPKRRLQALPHTPWCIGCARQHGPPT
ncbi:MAG: TraR/DksA C4-type zinc finger protein [Planctomycetia bacterium]|nr:TraR/DksA C4-type zinc finger protein [Planctomycetia bacterium]